MFLVQSWKFSLVYGIAGKLPSPSYLLPATPVPSPLIGAGWLWLMTESAMISTPCRVARGDHGLELGFRAQLGVELVADRLVGGPPFSALDGLHRRGDLYVAHTFGAVSLGTLLGPPNSSWFWNAMAITSPGAPTDVRACALASASSAEAGNATSVVADIATAMPVTARRLASELNRRTAI